MKTVILMIFLIMSYTNSNISSNPTCVFISHSKDKDNKYVNYMNVIKHLESPKNSYNRGHHGYYQLSTKNIYSINKNININDFYKRKELQDSIMIIFTSNNEINAEYIITEHSGCHVKNILLDSEVILCGIHFAGMNGMFKFIVTDGKYNPSDGYIKLSDHLRRFIRIRNRLHPTNIDYKCNLTNNDN